MKKSLLVLVLVLAAACGDTGGGEAPGLGVAVASETVEIDEFAFGPSELTVPVESEVTWRHAQPGVAHTVTADGGSWLGTDSGRMTEGESFSYTFVQEGTYRYFCSIHPSMRGVITVTE